MTFVLVFPGGFGMIRFGHRWKFARQSLRGKDFEPHVQWWLMVGWCRLISFLNPNFKTANPNFKTAKWRHAICVFLWVFFSVIWLIILFLKRDPVCVCVRWVDVDFLHMHSCLKQNITASQNDFIIIKPWTKLTWNLNITCLKRMIIIWTKPPFWVQNVNFPGCTHLVHQLYIIHPSPHK